jgi:hypothetical protein
VEPTEPPFDRKQGAAGTGRKTDMEIILTPKKIYNPPKNTFENVDL